MTEACLSTVAVRSDHTPQLEPEVHPTQRAFAEAQNELGNPVAENKQPKGQVEGQVELENKIEYLERADFKHREIVGCFRDFAAANGWAPPDSPHFNLFRTPDYLGVEKSQTYD